jgi:cytochrome c-type biogenesis protein CcmH/NrfG
VNTSKENDEQLKLRAYLLGVFPDADEQEEIELRLMLDKDYFQELLLQEEQLIEDYIVGGLDAEERKVFESHFLIPAERREKVKLERLLRNHISETTLGDLIRKKWRDFKPVFLSPTLATAAISIIVISVILFFWWRSSNPDVNAGQKALISLNRAYESERLVESRISGLDYAPYVKTRGSQDEAKVNWRDRDQAQKILLDEADKNPTAENLHLLARVYLTGKEFDKALELLKEAQQLSPQSPEVFNDIGTIYFEKSKVAAKDEEKLTLVADAVANFDKALAINPNLLTARFNKALATEVYLPNRAKEAWQEYLNLDKTSKWADEARKRLEELNKQETRHISTAEEMESAFLQAYNEQNNERAFQIAGQNRELIYERYLPQKLAMTLVNKKKTKKIKKLNF